MDLEQSKWRCKELTKEAHAGWIGISNQIAIGNVLKELEKKECKYIRQDNDWIVYQCSNCKMDWVFEEDEPKDSEFNYCPKCGAKIVETIELEEK